MVGSQRHSVILVPYCPKRDLGGISDGFTPSEYYPVVGCEPLG